MSKKTYKSRLNLLKWQNLGTYLSNLINWLKKLFFLLDLLVFLLANFALYLIIMPQLEIKINIELLFLVIISTSLLILKTDILVKVIRRQTFYANKNISDFRPNFRIFSLFFVILPRFLFFRFSILLISPTTCMVGCNRYFVIPWFCSNHRHSPIYTTNYFIKHSFCFISILLEKVWGKNPKCSQNQIDRIA